MTNLRETRARLMRLLWVLLGVAALAGIFLVSPLSGGGQNRREEFDRLRAQLAVARKEAAAISGLDGKLTRARTDSLAFIRERLPARNSDIATTLGTLADRHGVNISQVGYDTEPAELEGLQRVRIEASLEGDYGRVVRYINALEREKTFFLINGVDLAEQQGGRVKLQLSLETYQAAGA